MTLKLSSRFWAALALVIIVGLTARQLSLPGPFALIVLIPALIWAYERSDDFRSAVRARRLPGRNGAISLFIGATFSIFAVTFGVAIVLAILNMFTAAPSDVVLQPAHVPPAIAPAPPIAFPSEPWFRDPAIEQMFRLSVAFLFIAGPLIWHLWLRRRDRDTGPAPRWPLLFGPIAGIVLVLAASTAFDSIRTLAADAVSGWRMTSGVDWLWHCASFTLYAGTVGPFLVLWLLAAQAKGGGSYDNGRAFRWSIGIYLGANVVALIGVLLVVVVSPSDPSGRVDLVSGTGLAMIFGIAAILLFFGRHVRMTPNDLIQGMIAWPMMLLGALPMWMIPSAFSTSNNGFEPVVHLFAIVIFPVAVLILWGTTGLARRWFLQPA